MIHQLRFVYGIQIADCFTFNDYLRGNYQFRLIVTHHDPFISNWKGFLAFNCKATFPEFDRQGVFVDLFEKPCTQRILHFKGGTEKFFSKLAFQ